MPLECFSFFPTHSSCSVSHCGENKCTKQGLYRGLQKGRGELGSGQGSTQGRMKNSLPWFPPGAIRSEAGLGRLCKQRGVLGSCSREGRISPGHCSCSPFLPLDWNAFLDVGGQHLELLLSCHCLFQVRIAFALNGTKNHGHVLAWGTLCQS